MCRSQITWTACGEINPAGSISGNAPQNWSTQSTGLAATGSIEDLTSFRPLSRNPETGYWTPDGDAVGVNSYPANFLKLGLAGGVPGAPTPLTQGQGNPSQQSVQNFDRYAIVAFEVDRTAMYAISDSRFSLAGPSFDGAEVRVFVDAQSAIINKRIQQAGPDTSDTTNFDTSLGLLPKGSKVYVAFGAVDNQVRDFFRFDFTIYRTSTEITVADYVDDFDSATTADGWQYLWNAPEQWEANSALGDLGSGAITDTGSLTPLRSTGSGIWTADGDANGMNNGPANFLRLGKGFGIPGTPAGIYTLENQASTTIRYQQNQQDRFAVAGFTIENSGSYAAHRQLFANGFGPESRRGGSPGLCQ